MPQSAEQRLSAAHRRVQLIQSELGHVRSRQIELASLEETVLQKYEEAIASLQKLVDELEEDSSDG